MSQTEQAYNLYGTIQAAPRRALTRNQTAIRSPGLPLNGFHPRNSLITTHLPTQNGWNAELAWLADP